MACVEYAPHPRFPKTESPISRSSAMCIGQDYSGDIHTHTGPVKTEASSIASMLCSGGSVKKSLKLPEPKPSLKRSRSEVDTIERSKGHLKSLRQKFKSEGSPPPLAADSPPALQGTLLPQLSSCDFFSRGSFDAMSTPRRDDPFRQDHRRRASPSGSEDENYHHTAKHYAPAYATYGGYPAPMTPVSQPSPGYGRNAYGTASPHLSSASVPRAQYAAAQPSGTMYPYASQPQGSGVAYEAASSYYTTASSSMNPPSQESYRPFNVLAPASEERGKARCYEHGCNGREFSTFSNLLRHQRERDGKANKSYCEYCGAEFTRSTAKKNHVLGGKCRAHPNYKLGVEEYGDDDEDRRYDMQRR